LSLAVIKLVGPGEYVLERPGDPEQGHFGLAVQDYTHSTAPNRRYADVVTQRLIKSVLDGKPRPYSDNDLAAIAAKDYWHRADRDCMWATKSGLS
jgi:exoribonuclease R